MLFHQGMSFGQCLETVFCVTQVGTDVRQHGAKIWNDQHCPGRTPGGNPLADLYHPLLTLALHGQRPSTQERSHGRPLWKALRDRERNGGLCLLVHG
jgi:hypothetical protein